MGGEPNRAPRLEPVMGSGTRVTGVQGSDPEARPQAVKTCLEVGYVGFSAARAYKSSARQETELT